MRRRDFQGRRLYTVCFSHPESITLGRADMASEMVFWWSQQHFGALDALQSDHGHGTLRTQLRIYTIVTILRVVRRALAPQSSTISLLVELKLFSLRTTPLQIPSWWTTSMTYAPLPVTN